MVESSSMKSRFFRICLTTSITNNSVWIFITLSFPGVFCSDSLTISSIIVATRSLNLMVKGGIPSELKKLTTSKTFASKLTMVIQSSSKFLISLKLMVWRYFFLLSWKASFEISLFLPTDPKDMEVFLPAGIKRISPSLTSSCSSPNFRTPWCNKTTEFSVSW